MAALPKTKNTAENFQCAPYVCVCQRETERGESMGEIICVCALQLKPMAIIGAMKFFSGTGNTAVCVCVCVLNKHA